MYRELYSKICIESYTQRYVSRVILKDMYRGLYSKICIEGYTQRYVSRVTLKYNNIGFIK